VLCLEWKKLPFQLPLLLVFLQPGRESIEWKPKHRQQQGAGWEKVRETLQIASQNNNSLKQQRQQWLG